MVIMAACTGLVPSHRMSLPHRQDPQVPEAGQGDGGAVSCSSAVPSPPLIPCYPSLPVTLSKIVCTLPVPADGVDSLDPEAEEWAQDLSKSCLTRAF